MATIKEIAKRLGLSHSVVSRALNPNPDENARVSAETRMLVEEEACKVGYRRNRSAEFMRRGRSAAIGVFLPDYSNSHIADLVMGMSAVASERGFPLDLNFGLTFESYASFFAANIANPSSGLISYPFAIDADEHIRTLLRGYLEGGGKALVLNSNQRYDGVPLLSMDEEFGGKLAAERLLLMGCSRYFLVGRFDGRSEVFSARIAAAGRDCVETDVENASRLAAAAGASAFPLGFFAVTDELAMRLMNELRNAGFRVGGEVYVVGYDDLHLTGLLDPPLTTIRQPFREQGRRAVEKLLNMIYGGDEEDELIVPRLVARGSG